VEEEHTAHSFLSFADCFVCKDRAQEIEYGEWKRHVVYMHIALISFITGMLYLIYTAVSIYVFPKDAINSMILLHLGAVALPLFLISLFAYQQRSYRMIVFAMMIAPIIAMVVYHYLLERVGWKGIYLPEVYLIIIWTFAISGLSLLEGTISAGIILLFSVTVGLFFSDLMPAEKLLHMFWLSVSFILGFLGAFMLERHHKINFFQHQILEKLATTDTLTGVHNRTQFREFLQTEIDKAKESSYMFGLMMIDIDYFKEVNDTYGHQKGDEVLKGITNLLSGNIRASDTIIRWGGEEFIIICRTTYKAALIKFSHKIRTIIAGHFFKDVGARTVSIGVTCFQIGDSIDSMLNRVDRALHHAKENGRNRVEYQT
jgi:diguanylate cyclase (GGDEF)-like protein